MRSITAAIGEVYKTNRCTFHIMTLSPCEAPAIVEQKKSQREVSKYLHLPFSLINQHGNTDPSSALTGPNDRWQQQDSRCSTSVGAMIRLAASKRAIIQLGAYRKQLMDLSQNASAAPFASTCWSLQVSTNDSSVVAWEMVSKTLGAVRDGERQKHRMMDVCPGGVQDRRVLCSAPLKRPFGHFLPGDSCRFPPLHHLRPKRQNQTSATSRRSGVCHHRC